MLASYKAATCCKSHCDFLNADRSECWGQVESTFPFDDEARHVCQGHRDIYDQGDDRLAYYHEPPPYRETPEVQKVIEKINDDRTTINLAEIEEVPGPVGYKSVIVSLHLWVPEGV
jgi:hypothetical protein